jgi:hypothetical protein
MNQNAIALAIAGVMPAARATGLIHALATFQNPSGLLTANGTPDGNYVNISGLIDVNVMAAPSGGAGGNIQATQQKAVSQDTFSNKSHVLMDGYYPAVEACWRFGGRMILNGQIYDNNDICGVEADSQSQMTRVEVMVVTV